MRNGFLVPSFPIRRRLREGESVEGWCWRIYPDNGHEVPPSVRVATQQIRLNQILEPSDVLSQLVGYERLVSARTRELRLLEPWPSQPAPRWYEWEKRPRFCPLCIAEDKCHLLSWDLPLVSACAVHGCQLTVACGACRQKWSWATLEKSWNCICGAKIADAPVEQASLFAVRFSKLLANAADAQVPEAVKKSSKGSEPACFAYRVRDVYEIVYWLLRMRRAIGDSLSYERSRYWPMVVRSGARMKPGSWELAVTVGLPHSLNSKERRVLRWFFRRNRSTLVDLGSIVTLPWAEKLLDELDTQRNPLARLVHGEIGTVRREYCAGIPGLPLMLFNPRFEVPKLNVQAYELASWWCQISAIVSPLTSTQGLNSKYVVGDEFSALSRRGTEMAVNLLNVVFDAVQQASSPHAHNPDAGS